MNKQWRLIELYPDYKNRDLIKKLDTLNVKQYKIVMEGFVNANLNETQANGLTEIAYIHKPTRNDLCDT